MRPLPRRLAHPGASLVEALVALVILGVGVLSLGGAAAAAAGLLREASLTQGATMHAAALLDSLAADPAHGAGTQMRPPYTLDWSTTDSTGLFVIAVTVRYNSGAAPRQLDFARRSAPPPILVHD